MTKCDILQLRCDKNVEICQIKRIRPLSLSHISSIPQKWSILLLFLSLCWHLYVIFIFELLFIFQLQPSLYSVALSSGPGLVCAIAAHRVASPTPLVPLTPSYSQSFSSSRVCRMRWRLWTRCKKRWGIRSCPICKLSDFQLYVRSFTARFMHKHNQEQFVNNEICQAIFLWKNYFYIFRMCAF